MRCKGVGNRMGGRALSASIDDAWRGMHKVFQLANEHSVFGDRELGACLQHMEFQDAYKSAFPVGDW